MLLNNKTRGWWSVNITTNVELEPTYRFYRAQGLQISHMCSALEHSFDEKAGGYTC